MFTEVSDDEDEETLPENFKPEPILELTVRNVVNPLLYLLPHLFESLSDFLRTVVNLSRVSPRRKLTFALSRYIDVQSYNLMQVTCYL